MSDTRTIRPEASRKPHFVPRKGADGYDIYLVDKFYYGAGPLHVGVVVEITTATGRRHGWIATNQSDHRFPGLTRLEAAESLIKAAVNASKEPEASKEPSAAQDKKTPRVKKLQLVSVAAPPEPVEEPPLPPEPVEEPPLPPEPAPPAEPDEETALVKAVTPHEARVVATALAFYRQGLEARMRKMARDQLPAHTAVHHGRPNFMQVMAMLRDEGVGAPVLRSYETAGRLWFDYQEAGNPTRKR